METTPNHNKIQRSLFLKAILLAFASTKAFSKTVIESVTAVGGNFKYIYSNSVAKSQFFNFLKNVFHIYPEKDFHNLIDETTSQYTSDQDIYEHAQAKLSGIQPVLEGLRYEYPALVKQKDEMARETLKLLGEGGTYHGYLEVGSSGRYLDYLKKNVTIKGEKYYADGKEPGYSLMDMADRGQISLGATYIPLAGYHTHYADVIPAGSLDLVTVYIGFHHCPLDLRVPFISSVRDTLRPGGKLILRDHDCNTEEQKTLVALAHDVFNLGTKQSWEYNHKEVRNFYSLDFICKFVSDLGFRFEQRTLFQPGDPTKNALMLFTKV